MAAGSGAVAGSGLVSAAAVSSAGFSASGSFGASTAGAAFAEREAFVSCALSNAVLNKPASGRSRDQRDARAVLAAAVLTHQISRVQGTIASRHARAPRTTFVPCACPTCKQQILECAPSMIPCRDSSKPATISIARPVLREITRIRLHARMTHRPDIDRVTDVFLRSQSDAVSSPTQPIESPRVDVN